MFNQIPETVYGVRKRIQFIYKEIEHHISNVANKREIKVLDIGCGTGELITIPLGLLGIDILGVDIHLPSIEYARKKNPYPNVSFECIPPHELPDDRKFDFIVCSEVLEHLAEPQKMLELIRGKLKPGGIAFITVPNGYGPFELESCVARAIGVSGNGPVVRFAKRLLLRRGEKQSSTQGLDTLNIDSPHIQHFTLGQLKSLLDRSELVMLNKVHRTFLAGPITAVFMGKSRRAIIWNAKIADRLPYFLVSDWMFTVKH